MTVAATAVDAEDLLERLGRVAISTQGVLYGVVGLLAVEVAAGDHDAKPSQRGALESVARQPFGRALLLVMVVGLAAHALWRLVLAWRGERGEDDSKSLAKRAGNLGRAAIYASFVVAAVGLLTRSDSQGGGGNSEQRGTAAVLSWPGGTLIVLAVGAAVIGAGLWNAKRAVTRSFTDSLDLSSLDERPRRTVEILGTIGYLARFGAFALVGWFLITAGLQHDSNETRGLDQALRELATTSSGPPILFVLAVGLVLFGAYRVLDALFRRADEITHA